LSIPSVKAMGCTWMPMRLQLSCFLPKGIAAGDTRHYA
jgi:hypothetical protein